MEGCIFLHGDQLVVILAEEVLDLLEQAVGVCLASSRNGHDVLCVNKTAFFFGHVILGSYTWYNHRKGENHVPRTGTVRQTTPPIIGDLEPFLWKNPA